MDEKDAEKPSDRETRLARALRENLKRRKTQERERAAAKAEPEEGG